jgi:hypothetical protein
MGKHSQRRVTPSRRKMTMLGVSDGEPTCYLAQERRKGVANMVARQIGWRRSGEGEFDR